MQDFTYYNPTKIIFGKGKTKQVGKVTALYGKRILLLYGKGSVKKTGLYDTVIHSLKEEGLKFVECGGIKSNPVLSLVKNAIELFRKENLDVIVALGGGSVIDTAKAVAAGACYDGDVWDFFIHKASVTKAIPILVVLTLAASASEMNDGGVITKEETLQKYSLGGEPLFPKVSILDPENTFTVPQNYSMFGAVDAIVHLLESYFNALDPFTPFQDRFIEGLIKTIIESAEKIFHEPENYNARANLMWCATWGLNGLAPAGVGSTGFPMHMIEHSLSAIYNIPHGAGLSIILPAWMKHKTKEAPKKVAQLAERVFNISEGSVKEKAILGIEAIENWFKKIGVPTRLEDSNIPASDIRKIAENAFGLAQTWNLNTYTVEVIEDILHLAAKG
jgi:alcohol dehydrogenase YqhD (iron-dependent ADH family)